MGKDPGFGQSILHEGQLIFRTPPYILNEITLQDTFPLHKKTAKTTWMSDSPKVTTLERDKENKLRSSPNSLNEKRSNRRYSSTSIR